MPENFTAVSREKEEQQEARKEWTRKMLERNVMEQADGQLVIAL